MGLGARAKGSLQNRFTLLHTVRRRGPRLEIDSKGVQAPFGSLRSNWQVELEINFEFDLIIPVQLATPRNPGIRRIEDAPFYPGAPFQVLLH